MAQFVKFPSIEQYRNVISTIDHHTTFTGQLDAENKPVYDKTRPLPTMLFRGTVKLHGTNAGVGWNQQYGIWAQSRNQVLVKSDQVIEFAKTRKTHLPRFSVLLCHATHLTPPPP